MSTWLDANTRVEHRDVGDVLSLIASQLAVHALSQYFAKADDRGQWSAQLMAHLGEELRLELTGSHKLSVRVPQLNAIRVSDAHQARIGIGVNGPDDSLDHVSRRFQRGSFLPHDPP